MQVKLDDLNNNYDYVIIGAGIIGFTLLRDLVNDVILSNEKNLIDLKVGYTQFLKSEKMTKYSLTRISYFIYKKFF